LPDPLFGWQTSWKLLNSRRYSFSSVSKSRLPVLCPLVSFREISLNLWFCSGGQRCQSFATKEMSWC
jgi:hypothetical protein